MLNSLKLLHMSMTEKIKKLNEQFYNWATVGLNDPDNTNPYLIIPDERYQNASFRILVLGKETNGWGEKENCKTQEELENLYEHTVLDKSIMDNNGFWRFYFKFLLQSLEARPDVGVCVSNVALLGYKYGYQGYNPKYASALGEYLGGYIKILEPNVIICVAGIGTGKQWDYLKILQSESALGTYLGYTPTCVPSLRELSFASNANIKIYGTRHPQGTKHEWKKSVVDFISDDIIPKPQAEVRTVTDGQ